MGLRQNLAKMIRRESVSSNINVAQSKYRISRIGAQGMFDYNKMEEVRRDQTVETGFNLLSFILSSRKMQLVPAENGEEQKEFIEQMFNEMDTEIGDIIKTLLTGMLYGFSAMEIIYENQEEQLKVTNVVPIHIKTLMDNPFVYDDKGELVALHQVWNTEDIEIPINKILLYSHNALFDEHEGRGLLEELRPIVEDKVNIMNDLMTTVTRLGSPFLVGKTAGNSRSKQLQEAFEEIKTGTTGITVGLEDSVEAINVSSNNMFFDALDYKNREILKRFYVGNLLMDSGNVGSYAQSQTQLDVLQYAYDGLLETLANVIQIQIIDRVVDYNWGGNDLSPRIEFDKFHTGDLHALFTTLQPMLSSGLVDVDNTAVQDALALLFEREANIIYEPEEVDVEDEVYIPEPEEVEQEEEVTGEIVNDINSIFEGE